MKEKEILSIEDYNYQLAESQIAKYPLAKRDESKLLIYKPGDEITHSRFSNLSDILPNKSLLVFNNTKVLNARLQFQKETGAEIEIFCLSPVEPSDYERAMTSNHSCIWKCMIGNRKKWKSEELKKTILIKDQKVEFIAKLLKSDSETSNVQFKWDKPVEFFQILLTAGQIPIPPYLKRNTEEIDFTRYQTIFAKSAGSVAAPTASLHFTKEVMGNLKVREHRFTEITLHVGAGTFQPVSKENALEHSMHAEFVSISKQTIIDLLHSNGPIVPAGTTALRTIESLYWLGCKLTQNNNDIFVDQWIWKNILRKLPKRNALEACINYIEDNDLGQLDFFTSLMIHPGYEPQLADVLITNFHQPKSTLLLLVAAFVGNKWKDIYKYALTNNFRFLSYGDSSILFKNPAN